MPTDHRITGLLQRPKRRDEGVALVMVIIWSAVLLLLAGVVSTASAPWVNPETEGRSGRIHSTKLLLRLTGRDSLNNHVRVK